MILTGINDGGESEDNGVGQVWIALQPQHAGRLGDVDGPMVERRKFCAGTVVGAAAIFITMTVASSLSWYTALFRPVLGIGLFPSPPQSSARL